MANIGSIVRADKARILVADDEKSIHDMYRLVLSSEFGGNRIDMAVNGSEAVECFRSVHHGVIIMDLNMPVKNGIQAYEEIQEICNASNWEMPAFIFCTGFEPPKALDGIVGGNSRHCLLFKPVDINTLFEKIRHAIMT